MPSGRGGRRCWAVREVLSAGLDGEATRVEQTDADTHLAGCRACRRWFEAAAAMTRRVRTGSAAAGPDVTAAVLPAAPGRWRVRVAGGLRFALAVIGVAQLVLAVVQISTAAASDGHTHAGFAGASMRHLGHESGAWSLGLAVGFLWVAARRARPSAILPVLTTFTGFVVLLNISDLTAGRVELAHVAGHLGEVVGFMIVLVLSRPSLSTQHSPPATGARGAGTSPLPQPTS